MKHIFNLLTISILWVANSYAQDVITTKKGEDIQAKVLEITLKEIKYKKFDNPNSPVYTLLKSDVLLIRYENGSKDIFNEENLPKSTQKLPSLINIVDKRYYIDGNRVSLSEVRNVLYQDEQAKKNWQKSQGLMVGSVVCSMASIGFSIYSISNSLDVIDKKQRGEYAETSATPLIAACGLLIPAFVFYRLSTKAKVDAVETYNRNLQKKITLAPAVDQKGIGIALRF